MQTNRYSQAVAPFDANAGSDRSNVTVPPPFVYELDDINIEVETHRRRNAPRGLVRSVVIVFKQGTLAGLKLHGFSVWTDRRSDERKVRYPSRDWQTASDGQKRPWDLLRASDRDDFTPHRRLDRLLLDAVDAAPPVTVTIG